MGDHGVPQSDTWLFGIREHFNELGKFRGCAVYRNEAPEVEPTIIDGGYHRIEWSGQVGLADDGSEIGDQHLQDMANAGSGLPVGGTENAEYFVALNYPYRILNQ